ncbi:MAG: tryptophan synthase subunit beta like protein [Hahellaceae bacterium]|jgi:hypothetical protein|nr:tryptophan synthase subunit beta like protein [Hahellaceae bacterium]
MLYAEWSADGRITALSVEPRPGFKEVNPGDPEVLRFHGAIAQEDEGRLARSDLDFVRVLEDVIELLTDKGLLRYTDLPPAAQEKLNARQRLREKHRGLNLLSQQDDLLF